MPVQAAPAPPLETTVQVCAGETRVVALDELAWGDHPMLHRLRVEGIEDFEPSAIKLTAPAGGRTVTIRTGTLPTATVLVTARVIETDEIRTAAMVVEVLPETTTGGTCVQLTGMIFCDTSPRNNLYDADEAPFAGVRVAVSSSKEGESGGAPVLTTGLLSNGVGVWHAVARLSAGQWTHTATYTFKDESTQQNTVTHTLAANAATTAELPPLPMASLNVCYITMFSTLLVVVQDCRCSVVKIDAMMTATAAASPVVVARPLTLIGMNNAGIDGSALPATVPLLVTEGPHAELALKTLTIHTDSNAAVVLASGHGHQLVATHFTFALPPAVVFPTVLPRTEISWCFFEITQSTHAMPAPVFAVAAATGFGEHSLLLRNTVHTPTCLNEKLLLTNGVDAGGADILFTSSTCGVDSVPTDPCVYGRMNARTGDCDCEYGCTAELCQDPAESATGSVYVCYDSAILGKRVPLLLDVDKAALLLNHAADKYKDDDPVHMLRDACEDVDGVPRSLCKQHAPPEPFRCNCGAPGQLNHTIAMTDVQQVLSEIMGVVLVARRAEVKNVERDNTAYENAFWLVSAFSPVFLGIIFLYIVSQTSEWAYEYKVEAAFLAACAEE